MPPKISVLVPVFNGEAYLAECLDSVRAQDFADFELLIGDNGSSDGTPAMIERYAAMDQRIRWWRNPRNLGMAGNFNVCLREARGDHIKYVLHDDKLMAPNALWLMTEALDKHPSAAMVASATILLDGQSRRLGVRDAFLRSGLFPGRRAISQCLADRQNSIGEPSAVMFRRQLAARGFDPRFHLLIDLEMWFYLLEQGDFAYVADQLCAFRTHAGQYSLVCHQNKRLEIEYPELLVASLAKPWFRQEFSKDAIFANIHHIQKWKNPANQTALRECFKLMPRPAYYWHFAKSKLNRQRKKLLKHLRAYGRSIISWGG